MAAENHETTNQAMQLMVNAGDAKEEAHQALRAARDGDFDLAKEKLTAAREKLNVAHNVQTAMLTDEAQGKPVQLTLLVVHAQDHLMTAITYVDLVEELVALYDRLDQR
ncbi:PTS lactose/cellobiose transporter subunit IIA [Limosilactobacillus antri]|uniref:PTS family cellobiose porter, IIC component n=1 Tax=Limosilactobacillus antri DSM 16041 TaxID=525309 RepID=C8P984_9LACO|nr:PTS lactose/cellobiose transporter subunit IIA [Limosilactobacillus antri]EEW52950.1 PTS system, Lactose/Cellobiose specific IIA subunit [Limosilactobacillus antri DSM 16041]KRK59511.1 PTS family cellobiose porter, IIC component [Limosilactobacillus antri DSM 16041]